MARTKKYTPEETLRSLFNLQFIDSRIDSMREVRGELPMEVNDLEDEMAGLNKRLDKIEEEIGELNSLIMDKKNIIEESKITIKKYLEQQKNVRNNREFDSLSKEIEYQELEAQLAEKRIKENVVRIDDKKEVLDEVKELLKAKEEALEAKNNELKEIVSETEREEKLLLDESEKASKSIEERFLKAYKRIRGASKNGLAVVPVERGASGGSFIKIPPQVQLDIAARKKIIVDEHSGRILVDALLAEEQSTKMNRKLNKVLKA
ncbi:MAG: zinc ribbon domain-containing protein [Parvicellaceae bacterium]|jgi:predicted  nucleic acid-binding Zn-ribbon protein|tara:strand:+ start:10595 stop:11383 length:789 start_codon:yes stop_codon:yes gene_type:complete